MSEDLPSSPSALRNRDPILDELHRVLRPGMRVLEIASGTGEHAVHFGKAMPLISWQPTDRDLNEMGLAERLKAQAPNNVSHPFLLDIAHWPNLRPKFDAVISINCIHIAPEALLPAYVKGAATSLKSGGRMILYGPFRYGGAFDVPSNAQFDAFLRETYPGAGIRDFEQIHKLASDQTLRLEHDVAMPANNRFLVWRKP